MHSRREARLEGRLTEAAGEGEGEGESDGDCAEEGEGDAVAVGGLLLVDEAAFTCRVTSANG